MPAMNDRSLARSIAVGRILFGALMLLVPRTVLSRVAEDGPGPLVWMARAFGIRDVVLGAGAVRALSQAEPDTSWVRMGAVADTSDIVAALVWRKELGPRATAATLSLAVPAAVGGWKATSGLS
jgi:hypothetical protein